MPPGYSKNKEWWKRFASDWAQAWSGLSRVFPRLVLFLTRYLWAVAGLLILSIVCWEMASRHLPGLAPEPLAPVSVTQSALPPESHLKVMLTPPINVWEQVWEQNGTPESDRETVEFDQENDGDERGVFQGSFTSAPGDCIHANPSQITNLSIPAHQAVHTIFQIDTSGCKDHIPVEISIRFHYLWALPSEPGKRPRRSPDKTSPTENLQVPSTPPTGASPMELNLSIQLPPSRQSSGGKAAIPSRSYAGSLTTSPITITSQRAVSVHRALLMLAAIAKEFTWPLLIAILTIVGQNTLARRSEQQQIRNNRLQTLTSLMQRHYLPIARRMQAVTIEGGKIGDANLPANISLDSQLRRTFSAILLMRKRILHLVNSKGGVFFPSPLAENIFTAGIGYVYLSFQTATADPDLCESLAASLVLDAMLYETANEVFSRVFESDKIEKAYSNFAAWAVDSQGKKTKALEDCLILLDLCEAVLVFEFDRVQYETEFPVFRTRYLDPPQFGFTGDVNQFSHDDAKPADPHAMPADLRQDILRQYTRYLDGMPKECRPDVIYPKL
jgi:hypothetical protein